MKQVEVLLPAAVAHGFDYLAPDDVTLASGDIVAVPFGRGESLGVVWGEGGAKIAKIKSVRRRLEQFPPLSEAMRQFIDWAAWYNCAPKGAMLKMVLPIAEIEKTGRLQMEPSIDSNHIALAQLSGEQQKAAAVLEEKIGSGFSVTLLDGVTGSGKTEVYFDAIAQVLQQKQAQVLVLLPEIALSVQWLERFKSRFGFSPLLWNSEITPARKRLGWQAIVTGEARVIVGARSALFLPYKNLSLIVIDEEHDQSYKQEEGVIYHARDMAVARGRFEKLPVVLVSATPSLESHYNARQGKYTELSLPSRHGGAQMPSLALLDMRRESMGRGAFICNALRQHIADAVASGHQAMLFLNRRGYAPLLLCRACGHRFQCPECSSWLVLHKRGGRGQGSEVRKDLFSPISGPRPLTSYLHCHHCDYKIPVPPTCPSCAAGETLVACGPGVERLSEEVAVFLPQARVAVMASDSMDGKALSETIAAMEEKRIDLLIGTQMIAKGHHFADLAVVGVVDADMGLAGGDLRAAERTYQLLHQLSGRAGRERIHGRVYLQSFLPTHPVMQALLSGERDAFLAAELQARQNAHMPPFARLAAVIIEGAKEELVMKAAKELAARFQNSDALHLYGPAPAPLYLLRGRYRWRLLVKAERSVNLPDRLRALVDTQEYPSSLRVKIDIDPVSFL